MLTFDLIYSFCQTIKVTLSKRGEKNQFYAQMIFFDKNIFQKMNNIEMINKINDKDRIVFVYVCLLIYPPFHFICIQNTQHGRSLERFVNIFISWRLKKKLQKC